MGVHANGDAGIDMVLKAYENAQNKCPKKNMRHRIEHSSFCHEEQFMQMKKLQVSPSFLIGHVYYYGNVFRDQLVGEERTKLLHRTRTALNKGLKVSIHSDYNCQPLDPLRCIYNAVTRIIRNTGEVLNQ